MKFCNTEAHYPTADMRWGLAATHSARHHTHIDSDGLGTYVDVRCGGKWWIVFCPFDGQDEHSFSSIDAFLDNFDTSSPDNRWRAEAVHLTPGTRL